MQSFYWRSFLRLASLCLIAALATGCGPVTLTLGGSPEENRLRPIVLETDGGWSNDRVAIIDITGLIHNSNKFELLRQGENPVSLLDEKLNAAASDARVKAVILRLNTPGGTVTASDAMYRSVMRFKASTKKPVIAVMMDVAASGGYYVACATDSIIAYPTTVTASIGVIFQTVSFRPGMERIGIVPVTIKSGPNKDAGSPFANMTDEQRATLQAMINDFYDGFTTVVKKARPGVPADKWAMATDGRVVTGRVAKEIGLVDQLGDIRDAMTLAKAKAGITRADLVIYRRPLDYAATPFAAAPGAGMGGGTQINLAQFNFGDALAEQGAGFYYLWQPTDLSR